MKMTLLTIYALLLLAVSCTKQSPAVLSVNNSMENIYNTKILLGAREILADVALTQQEKEQGLSGREKLTDGQGMLFDFSGQKNYMPGFWMKDMKFDLDLIWIQDGQVIGITENVPAPKTKGEKLGTYYPPSAVDAVLEVNAGWTEKNNIAVGDEVRTEK